MRVRTGQRRRRRGNRATHAALPSRGRRPASYRSRHGQGCRDPALTTPTSARVVPVCLFETAIQITTCHREMDNPPWCSQALPWSHPSGSSARRSAHVRSLPVVGRRNRATLRPRRQLRRRPAGALDCERGQCGARQLRELVRLFRRRGQRLLSRRSRRGCARTASAADALLCRGRYGLHRHNRSLMRQFVLLLGFGVRVEEA